MTTRAVPTPQPRPTPLDLRIEALAVAGDAHGLRDVSLTDYVVAHCVDVLREQVAARVNAMRVVGRL